MQSGTKNPPWARSNVNSNMTGMSTQMMDPNAMMSQQGMMPFQQSQAVFNPSMMNAQGGMTMPMAGQMPMNQMAQGQMYPGNVVAYPTPRALNPGMYQNNQSGQSQPSNNEQRVFTGSVTKTHNDFGFVDHDVFYQTSVCAKGVIPKVNDRVLVEATYNPNMPFKWNATRVQVLPKGGPNQNKGGAGGKSNTYNAVPPPQKSNNRAAAQNRRDDIRDRPPRREDRFPKRSRSRSRSRSRDRRDSRRRDASPPRKRIAVHQPSPVKYLVRMPRLPLDITGLDVPAISQRYTNMYIPSDFFSAQVKWTETFPPASPFSINHPCSYHVMSKEAEPLEDNGAVLEPPDADYRFSAKVMLVSVPSLELLYQKCGLTKGDDKDKRNNKNPLHPTRLIKFLVGQKGKGGENFAIGGPWSPSLDGDNPDSDPTVLVRTAIRTCKSLTGIDLSNCTQWYRMVEFYYWRESTSGPGRLETVVLFLPDVWSCAPTRAEWPDVMTRYAARGEAAACSLDAPQPKDDNPSQIENKASADDSTITIDENDDDEDKPEPTHHSKLDMRTIKVEQLRQELRARNVSCKGLRPQLLSRLTKLIKEEEAKDQKGEDVMVLEDDDADKKTQQTTDDKPNEDSKEAKDNKDVKDDKDAKDNKDPKDDKDKEKEVKKTEKDIEEEKKKLEREKASIKSRYELPPTPHLVVHPSRTAKGGKFVCTVATLSLLLDYRQTDNKEHSFEIFVFAELFNEMLMRDFGFYIYKTLYTLPEKVEEVKEKSAEKTQDKKEEKKDEKEKKEDKKEEEKKKDEDKKRDDKRADSRRRDRRGSQSDDERSASTPRKACGVDLPPDPYLLLSLAYFDTSRCGHIVRKDLQTLFTSLGLRLARSQIRAVLEKVCVKDQFNYKVLMQAIRDLSSGGPEAMQDLPLDTVTLPTHPEVPPHIAELEAAIAAGNRNLLPVFNRHSDEAAAGGATPDVSATGAVMYKSRLVDVGSTLAALSKALSAVSRLEASLAEARAAARSMRAAAAQTRAAERGAKTQLTDISDQLVAARNRVVSLTASSKIFHSALKSIQAKVEAVVNIKFEEEEVVEVVNGPNKVEKKELKKETQSEHKPDTESTPSSEQKDAESESHQKDTEGGQKDAEVAEASVVDTTHADMEIDDKE